MQVSGTCNECGNFYELIHLDRDGVCVDCREGGHCGTSKAPTGWMCTRVYGHEGPCAAHPICGHDHFTYHNPEPVACPCVTDVMGTPCGGTLQWYGTNRSETNVCLVCDKCACAHRADIFIRKDPACG